MTKPLKGMPNTKDAWIQHMKKESGTDSIDLARADRLGFDQDTVDKLHRADANKDGKLDWDEAWKAFDDFDTNGDSGSVDLDKLGKNDSALAFARGLNTLRTTNQKVTQAHTTATFDPSKTQTHTVGDRTVEFPPGTLAKAAVVDKDWKDRPQITFQLEDGTDGRLYQDPTDGWVAVVDHRKFKVDLGSGKIEIKGVLKDDTKNDVIEGHAFDIRAGGGSWTTVNNERAESYSMEADSKTIVNRTAPGVADFEVDGGTRFDAAWIGDGNKAREYNFHFQGGEQVALRWSGRLNYTVRADNGDWKSLQVPEGRLRYDKMSVQPDGTIRAETDGFGAQGATVDVFDKSGKLVRTLDFTDDRPRDALKKEGTTAVRGGDAAGIDLVNKAYKEQVDHGLIITRSDHQPGWQQRAVANSYGKRMGGAIADLAASGKTQEAQALQKKLVADLYSAESPFQDKQARMQILDQYSKAIVAKGEPTASTMLPELATEVRAQEGVPRRLYLSESTYQDLDTLAQGQIAAGKLDAAKALYTTAAGALMSADKPLLTGTKRSDSFDVTTGSGGTVKLNDPPDGTALKSYDGMKTHLGTIAATKAKQIEFSATWKTEAAAVPGLTLTADELSAVPPSPETMKKYFAAKYDGQMPAKMDAMQAELDAYMKVAFVHPQLNVPDTEKGWNAQGLATTADGRIAADCLCTNRAVAQMLSGVGGLKMSGVRNQGHSRLVVTSADGSKGFVQSNTNVSALKGKASDKLQDRVARTIEGNPGLQVMYGMPAPIRVGAGFETGSQLADVDAAFDASMADAGQSLSNTAATSTDGKIITKGDDVRAMIKRYEDFRGRADALAVKYGDTPASEVTPAMKKERETLVTEMAQLEKDLASLRGDVPSELRRFIDGQKKNGGIFDFGGGRDWLEGTGHLMLTDDQSEFSLRGSSW